MTDPDALIHHLVRAEEWVGPDVRVYAPASLEAEGFIHFSTAEQVAATSRRYYADVEQLLLVAAVVDRLGSELVWEDLSGNGVFPHLYGPLNLDAVLDVGRYHPGEPTHDAPPS